MKSRSRIKKSNTKSVKSTRKISTTVSRPILSSNFKPTQVTLPTSHSVVKVKGSTGVKIHIAESTSYTTRRTIFTKQHNSSVTNLPTIIKSPPRSNNMVIPPSPSTDRISLPQ